MTVIIKASEPAELLSLFPTLLGYLPHDSVVVLAFSGKRTCGTMRIDLPSAERPELFSRIASNAVGTICKIPGADGVAFAVFTSESFARSSDDFASDDHDFASIEEQTYGGSAFIPCADFADVLLDRISESGLTLKDGLCRAADGWGSYIDGGMPTGGYPLSMLEETRRRDHHEHPLRIDGRDLPDRISSAGPGPVRQMKERLDAIESEIERLEVIIGASPDATDDELEAMLGHDPRVVSAALDFSAFAEQSLEWSSQRLEDDGALLLWGILRPGMRDEIMLQWAFGRDDAAEPAFAPAHAPAPVIDIGDRMTGFGPRPDPDRMLRAIEILLYLIARAEGSDRRAPLCMVAWLSWGLGRASNAAKYLGEVGDIDADYSTGRVLSGMFAAFPIPEWAFSSEDRAEHNIRAHDSSDATASAVAAKHRRFL